MTAPHDVLSAIGHPEVEDERQRLIRLAVPCLFAGCDRPTSHLFAMVIEEPSGAFGVATWPDGMICDPHIQMVFAAIGEAQPTARRETVRRDGTEYTGHSWAVDQEHSW